MLNSWILIHQYLFLSVWNCRVVRLPRISLNLIIKEENLILTNR